MIYIIAIAGKMLAGKTTLKNLLVSEFNKKIPNIHVYERALSQPLKEYLKILKISNTKNERVRKFLQSLGDLVRNIFGEDFFVNYLISSIKKPGLYIIDDLRFKNEYNVLKQYARENENVSILFIRVQTNSVIRRKRAIKLGIDIYNENHISEIDLDDVKDWDVIVSNNKSIAELYDYYVLPIVARVISFIS